MNIRGMLNHPFFVMPVQASIQVSENPDSGIRRHDEFTRLPL